MEQERRVAGGHRVHVGQQATLVTSDGEALQIVVKNLSRGGFCFEHSGADLEVGDVVAISSRRGTAAKGQLEWVTSIEAGGKFLDVAAEMD